MASNTSSPLSPWTDLPGKAKRHHQREPRTTSTAFEASPVASRLHTASRVPTFSQTLIDIERHNGVIIVFREEAKVQNSPRRL